MPAMKKTVSRICVTTLAGAILAVVFAGCNRNGNSNSAASQTPADTSVVKPVNEPSPGTNFEHDLQYVRNSQFTYIWTFSRKDGRLFDSDDGAFLKTNAPQVIDWVKTDNGKKYIGGTNFDLEKGNLALLKRRFVVENYSGK
jgi:hypothetical protein